MAIILLIFCTFLIITPPSSSSQLNSNYSTVLQNNKNLKNFPSFPSPIITQSNLDQLRKLFETNLHSPVIKESNEEKDMAVILKALNLPADFFTVMENNHKIKNLEETIQNFENLPNFSIPTDDDAGILALARKLKLRSPPPPPPRRRPQRGQNYGGYHGYQNYQPVANTNHHHDGWGWSSSSSASDLDHNLQSSGRLVGQLARNIFDASRSQLPKLKPILLGLADSSARATQNVAYMSAHAARDLPPLVEDKAQTLKELTVALGDLTSHALYIMTPFISSAAVASRKFAQVLPYALEVLGEQGKKVAATGGKLAKVLSQHSQTVLPEVVKATKAKVNLVGQLVEGGHGFKSGLLEGIRRPNFDHQGYNYGWSSSQSVYRQGNNHFKG